MAQEVKHTPGPWYLINDHCVGGPQNVNGAGHGVAMCGMRARNEGEVIANARLVAAAPELLMALQDLLHAYSEPDRRLCCDGRDCGCMGSTVHQQAEHYARAAIAKAEGK
ncbi:hypothetical protein EVB56_038 [Rhizobium phage RHph_Y1_10]|nr:hypothetical protein EVB56_038 [Rhizobium phage RHph_Y1_10]